MTRIPARPARFAAAATATASAVILAAAPAHPATTGPAAAASTGRTATAALAAPADRPISELLAGLKVLVRESEAASAAYHRAARELREQQKLTDTLERRLARTRVQLSAERKAAARIARAQYRAGAPGLPPTLQVLLADDPVIAMHHGHALRRAAARQQATLRALASGERHRGAVAADARDALERQQRLADRKERKRQAAREALRKVERMLASLGPEQLAALHRYERTRTPGGGPGSTAGLSGDPADRTVRRR